MLRIGPVQLQTPVLLAPVAGHCDLPFRLVARELGGVGLAFTDLLCPHGILRQNAQTQWLMATCEDDAPLGMQLYGRESELMCEAARWALDAGATTIDINMGCPVDKVTKTFAGSMMLCIPDQTVGLAEQLIATVEKHSAGRVPVTAKTRLGWGHGQGDLTAPTLARRLVNAGVQAITIHGRTAEQRFKGGVCLNGIRTVVEGVHEAGGRRADGAWRVPCIGNGDIRTPFDAQRMIAATGCDGVMIARAALQAPWLMRDTAHLLQHGQLPTELTLRQRMDAYRRHVHLVAHYREQRHALTVARQKIGGYSKHMGPCKSLRMAIQKLKSTGELDPLIDSFLEDAGDAADQVPVTWTERDAIFHDEPAVAA